MVFKKMACKRFSYLETGNVVKNRKKKVDICLNKCVFNGCKVKDMFKEL